MIHWLIGFLLLANQAHGGDVPVRCATPAMLTSILERGLARAPVAPPSDTGDEDSQKMERDSYGVPNELESENFIVRWGNNGGVSASDAQSVLDAFEVSWDVEVLDMDHPAPTTSNQYLFNVYIADTGGNTPSSYGAAGYYNTDPDGYPMIVLATNTIADLVYGRTTIAHEFYHAIQHTTGSYSYSGDAAWYWEATASWIEIEVWPDDRYYAVFLFGYALLPYLPLNSFDYPDSGALVEYHQYGAFIFARYLAEFVGDWRIIRDSWVEPEANNDDPLESLRVQLAALDVDLDEAFVDFAGRNVTWDYEHGEDYDYYVDLYADYYSNEDARIVAEVPSSGLDGWQEVDEDTLPQRYGYNVVEMSAPHAGDLTVGFMGDQEGDSGSPAEWGVTVIQVTDDERVYQTVPIADGSGELTLEGVGAEDVIYLMVSVWTGDHREGEAFAWSYMMNLATTADTGLFVAPIQDDDDEGGGWGKAACGCASVEEGRPVYGMGWVLMMLAMLWSRRQPGLGPTGRL